MSRKARGRVIAPRLSIPALREQIKIKIRRRGGGEEGLGWRRKINLGSFDDAKMGKAIITLAPILQIARRNPIWAYFLFFIFFAANKEKPRPVKVK